MTRAVAKIVQVKYTYLAPVIIMFCFAGAYAATGNTKELILCAAILIFSYILTLLDISNTPLMLGMILEDIMEQNFVTAAMSYEKEGTVTFWHCGMAACNLARKDTGAQVGVHPNRKIGPVMDFGCEACE